MEEKKVVRNLSTKKDGKLVMLVSSRVTVQASIGLEKIRVMVRMI